MDATARDCNFSQLKSGPKSVFLDPAFAKRPFYFLAASISVLSALTGSSALAQNLPPAQSSAAPTAAASPTAETASASALPVASADTSPIALRDIAFVRRDLESLAQRHKFPPPPEGVTRQQLGTYFWQLVTAIAKVPKQEMSSQDYVEIGRLTADFEEVVQEIKGKLTMVVAKNDLPSTIPGSVSTEKGTEFAERLSVLEKVKINGDFTFLPQADSGRGIKDTMATNMRGRINFQCKVAEPPPDSMMGDAQLFLRLTAASGRFFPRNKYLMSPENAVVDSAANPFNTGINEVQVNNLQINNNNSNNTRPTVSMEQAWYGQELRLGKTLKGTYQVGLNNFANVFDANAMANNETLQFLNTQFVNNISWRPNFIGPSVIMQVHKSLLREKAFLRATSGMISLADRDFFGGWGTNHELQFGHRFWNKEGNLRAGFWQFDFRSGSQRPFTTPLDLSPSGLLSILPGGTARGSRPTGCYFNFDQRIWKDIGIWGRYGFNDKQMGEVFLGGLLSSRQAWSIGTEIPMKYIWKRRKDDVCGVAFGAISSYRRDGTVTPATPAFVGLNGSPATTLAQVNSNLAAMLPGIAPTGEKTMEVYYRMQMNKNVSVTPDFQYIWSPGAVRPQPGIFVAGVRMNVTF